MTAFGRCVILTEEHELMEASRRQFRALKREIDNALRELVREAVEDGTVVTSDVRLTAFTLAGALGWVARWYKDDGPQSATEIARMMRSEEHTSELQSLMRISYAVFCLKKKNTNNINKR